jgi:hypothetical protein
MKIVAIEIIANIQIHIIFFSGIDMKVYCSFSSLSNAYVNEADRFFRSLPAEYCQSRNTEIVVGQNL